MSLPRRSQVDVEVGEGLVHQHQPRPRGHGPRHGDALLLAAGQLVRVAVIQAAESDQVEQARRDGPTLAPGQAPQPERNVVRHAQVREEGVVLEHHADPAAVRRQAPDWARDLAAVELDRARADRLESGDGAQHGRLAAPTRAEQAADLAAPQAQREAVHCGQLTVAADQVVELQEGVGHGDQVFPRLAADRRASQTTGPTPARTRVTAGSAARCHSPSEVNSKIRTASVSHPKGRSSSVAGISFMTSTRTSSAAVSRPGRRSGR
jgi:hypothetical protein